MRCISIEQSRGGGPGAFSLENFLNFTLPEMQSSAIEEPISLKFLGEVK